MRAQHLEPLNRPHPHASALTGLLREREHVTESLSSLLPAAVAAAPQPPPDPPPMPKNQYVSLQKQPGLAEVPGHRNCRVGMFMKEVEWAGVPGGPVGRTSCFHCPGLSVQSLVAAAAAAAAAKLLQSCPTLCDPMDSSPPGTPIPRILQARTLESVAISFSNA